MWRPWICKRRRGWMDETQGGKSSSAYLSVGLVKNPWHLHWNECILLDLDWKGCIWWGRENQKSSRPRGKWNFLVSMWIRDTSICLFSLATNHFILSPVEKKRRRRWKRETQEAEKGTAFFFSVDTYSLFQEPSIFIHPYVSCVFAVWSRLLGWRRLLCKYHHISLLYIKHSDIYSLHVCQSSVIGICL